MRSVCWMAVAGLVLAVAGPAAGQVVNWNDQGVPNPYCAPACGAPMYGLAPGCCEFPPNCCSNAWDGYCEERARVMSRGDRMKAWFHSKSCRCSSCCPSEVVVTGQCAPPAAASAGGADPYYTPQAQAQKAPQVPKAQPAPLTPAMGRRLGYTRPAIRPQH